MWDHGQWQALVYPPVELSCLGWLWLLVCLIAVLFLQNSSSIPLAVDTTMQLNLDGFIVNYSASWRSADDVRCPRKQCTLYTGLFRKTWGKAGYRFFLLWVWRFKKESRPPTCSGKEVLKDLEKCKVMSDPTVTSNCKRTSHTEEHGVAGEGFPSRVSRMVPELQGWLVQCPRTGSPDEQHAATQNLCGS